MRKWRHKQHKGLQTKIISAKEGLEKNGQLLSFVLIVNKEQGRTNKPLNPTAVLEITATRLVASLVVSCDTTSFRVHTGKETGTTTTAVVAEIFPIRGTEDPRVSTAAEDPTTSVDCLCCSHGTSREIQIKINFTY